MKLNYVKFFIFFISLISLSIYADVVQEKKEPTWSLLSFSVGNTILKYNSIKNNISSESIAYTVHSNSVFYGLEYESIKNTNVDLSNFIYIFGYEPLWHKSIKPYVSIGLGYSTFKRYYNTKGYSTSLDIGFRIRRLSVISINSGMRYTLYNFDQLITVSSQRLYVNFSYEF